MKTVRVTTDIEPDTGNAPEFSCVPMTATNDIGATLELDDGCALHYEPPPGPTTTDSNAARLRRDALPAAVGNGGSLLPRQASCTPYTTFTRTVWKTETYTETGTRTVTVAGDDATFSCPEMEVTNDVGDTLALDADCILSFSPAEPTTTEEEVPAQTRPTGNSQPSGSETAAVGGSESSDNLASVDRYSEDSMDDI
ncbi:hypothetical protein ACLX1H_000569 [Fusarium chlamydosporum]